MKQGRVYFTVGLALLASFITAGLALNLEAPELIKSKGTASTEPKQCASPAVAASRDKDAQAILELIDGARSAARSIKGDAELRHITAGFSGDSAGSTFVFTGLPSDAPPIIRVHISPDGQLRILPLGYVTPDSKTAPLQLDDLTVGPEKAAGALHARYPSAQVLGMTLGRENCDLVWEVVGVIKDGSRSDPVRALVSNSTGEAQFPVTPPSLP